MKSAIFQNRVSRGIVFLIIGTSSADAGIKRVDSTRPSGGNGTSWALAYNDLAPVLSQASSGDEIWVAAGTYFPGASQTSSFSLRANV